MKRRILWLSVPFILIGIAIATWFVLARRDADFVTVGPKTKGVRANFAKLDTTVDPADFRDCKTVRDAVRRLSTVLRASDPEETDKIILLNIPYRCIRLDYQAIQAGSPFTLSADMKPMTVKQFLRTTFTQTDMPEVNYIVRGHYIEVTTAKQAQEERTRYLDSVSLVERMQTLWKEMTGTIEDDPPEPFFRL